MRTPKQKAYAHVLAGIERAIETPGLDAGELARLERMLASAREAADVPAPRAKILSLVRPCAPSEAVA